MNEVAKRVIIAIFFIPLILIALFNGGTMLLIFLSLVTGIATYEFRYMFNRKYPQIPWVIIPLNVLFLVGFSLNLNLAVLTSALIVMLFIAGCYIITNRAEGTLLRTSLTFFVVIYAAFFLSFGYRISLLDGGNYLLISIIIVVWITDTFAYFCGMLFGKHRGVFKVSPNKSAEGFIAGFIAAFGASFLLYLLFNNHITMYQSLAIGLSTGVFGQIGDLIESMLKRDAGVKDSSTIIPGHGGVLDRFDSFIITLPVFYLINNIISCL